jgi:hypothetical protein
MNNVNVNMNADMNVDMNADMNVKMNMKMYMKMNIKMNMGMKMKVSMAGWYYLLSIVVLCLALPGILGDEVGSSVGGGGNATGYEYPVATRTVEDGNIFLKLLNEGIPFGYAHFNDGEIRAINISNCFMEKYGQLTTDYGWQNCSEALGKSMKEALINTAENFYVGIPCACEWHGERTQLTLDYLDLSKNNPPLTAQCGANQMKDLKFEGSTVAKPWLKDRMTSATAFINGNYEIMRVALEGIMKQISRDGGRTIHAVCATGSNVHTLGFPVNPVFAASRHAYEMNYATMRTLEFVNSHFKENDVVLIMLGPLGRILASEWTLLSSKITFIDMGSFYDTPLHNRHFGPQEHAFARACNGFDDKTMHLQEFTFKNLHHPQ